MLLNRLLTVLFTDSKVEETLVLIPSTTVEMALFTLFQTVLATD
jgi:hypothetical protein